MTSAGAVVVAGAVVDFGFLTTAATNGSLLGDLGDRTSARVRIGNVIVESIQPSKMHTTGTKDTVDRASDLDRAPVVRLTESLGPWCVAVLPVGPELWDFCNRRFMSTSDFRAAHRAGSVSVVFRCHVFSTAQLPLIKGSANDVAVVFSRVLLDLVLADDLRTFMAFGFLEEVRSNLEGETCVIG